LFADFDMRVATDRVREIGGLGLVYFVLASVSIELARYGEGVTFLWPATSLLLTFLVVRPTQVWPWALIVSAAASWTASVCFGVGAWAGIPVAAAATFEALLSAYVLRRVSVDVFAFEDLKPLGLFVLTAGVIAPGISGLVGAIAIAHHERDHVWRIWHSWFLAHGLGTVTFAPLLMLLMRGDLRRMHSDATFARHAEGFGLWFLVALTSFIVFYNDQKQLLFLPLLPLLLTAFRMGRMGAAMSLVIMACIGGVLTALGLGPIGLMPGSTGSRVDFFQLYLAVAVMMVLPVAAELKRRRGLFLSLQRSEASYRLMAEKLADTLIHTDIDGRIRFASTAIFELSGYRASDAVDMNARDFVSPDDLALFEDARLRALASPEQSVEVEYRALTRDGLFEWRETRMRGYADEQGKPAGVIMVVRDSNSRRSVQNELTSQATTDPLTGSPNRRVFWSRLSYLHGEVAAGHDTGFLALLDLDFFKSINDQFGHLMGDAVLKAVADVVKDVLGQADLVARIGGEEFGVILWGLDEDSATQSCERIRLAISELNLAAPDGRAVPVTASIGMAEIASDVTALESFERADRALYDAKFGGRNQVRAA
jgi:diguanylate cyclase (GGDEF)-like protein/PAS domain S-box-containing protein